MHWYQKQQWKNDSIFDKIWTHLTWNVVVLCWNRILIIKLTMWLILKSHSDLVIHFSELNFEGTMTLNYKRIYHFHFLSISIIGFNVKWNKMKCHNTINSHEHSNSEKKEVDQIVFQSNILSNRFKYFFGFLTFHVLGGLSLSSGFTQREISNSSRTTTKFIKRFHDMKNTWYFIKCFLITLKSTTLLIIKISFGFKVDSII